jgi:hypothetical protein
MAFADGEDEDWWMRCNIYHWSARQVLNKDEWYTAPGEGRYSSSRLDPSHSRNQKCSCTNANPVGEALKRIEIGDESAPAVSQRPRVPSELLLPNNRDHARPSSFSFLWKNVEVESSSSLLLATAFPIMNIKRKPVIVRWSLIRF